MTTQVSTEVLILTNAIGALGDDKDEDVSLNDGDDGHGTQPMVRGEPEEKGKGRVSPVNNFLFGNKTGDLGAAGDGYQARRWPIGQCELGPLPPYNLPRAQAVFDKDRKVALGFLGTKLDLTKSKEDQDMVMHAEAIRLVKQLCFIRAST